MKTKKYTDEQLSRILSEAAAGTLGRAGFSGATSCIEQAAYATPAVWNSSRAWHWDNGPLKWRTRTPTRVLRWLESKGWA